MSPLSVLKKLCTPSKIYLCFSIFAVLINLYNYSNLSYFIKLCILSAFWTWNLNIICKAGYVNMSWVLIIFTLIITINNFKSYNEHFIIPDGNVPTALGWSKGKNKTQAASYATSKGWQGKGSNDAKVQSKIDGIYTHRPEFVGDGG